MKEHHEKYTEWKHEADKETMKNVLMTTSHINQQCERSGANYLSMTHLDALKDCYKIRHYIEESHGMHHKNGEPASEYVHPAAVAHPARV